MPTVCVVHHNNVLDSKQVLGNGYGTEGIHGAAACDHNRENCGGGGDLPIPLVVSMLRKSADGASLIEATSNAGCWP